MKHSILISIHPKWCEMIESGKKTIEIRKTRPKIATPFKCYIYCTKPNTGSTEDRFYIYLPPHDTPKQVNGTVIGEFMCNKIEEIEVRHFTVFGHENTYTAVGENPDYQWLQKSCLSYDEIVRYGKLAPLYGWHISDLIMYNKPKAISKFKPIPCRNNFDGECVCKINCKYQRRTSKWGYEALECARKITRPPQSWMYIKE